MPGWLNNPKLVCDVIKKRFQHFPARGSAKARKSIALLFPKTIRKSKNYPAAWQAGRLLQTPLNYKFAFMSVWGINSILLIQKLHRSNVMLITIFMSRAQCKHICLHRNRISIPQQKPFSPSRLKCRGGRSEASLHLDEST